MGSKAVVQEPQLVRLSAASKCKYKYKYKYINVSVFVFEWRHANTMFTCSVALCGCVVRVGEVPSKVFVFVFVVVFVFVFVFVFECSHVEWAGPGVW